MVDLLTEQAAAFYDYHKKKLFLLQGGDPSGQSMVVVHELAHAFADQRFDLGKFIRKGKSDDSSLARMAVMEGQATWLMMESASSQVGAVSETDAGGNSRYGRPQLRRACDAVSRCWRPLRCISRVFALPVCRGPAIQSHRRAERGPGGICSRVREPPVSSQQMMHPELYFRILGRLRTPLPKLRDEREWKTLTSGSLGEFDHAVLLEQYLGRERADDIAPHWRGGSARSRRAQSR